MHKKILWVVIHEKFFTRQYILIFYFIKILPFFLRTFLFENKLNKDSN